ncbi:hypothetical protein [Phormidium sp. CCY1219]|uniref:hypothetical protein n=1 Tax=Phormidium sp. CCY1219 TaxID=2886104 RepID=UPI002D1E9507|nr:hypothetical protein [Phormidium sp. CCY1219]MEB3826803.1 hypothetical protein [Phormidium sp. CCY1219]
MFWLFLAFFVLLLISATPLLGTFNVRWSFEIMIALFGIFFVGGWVLLFCYPLFN